MHRQCAMPVCLWVATAGGAENIILSAGGVESMMLSVHAESMDTLGQVCPGADKQGPLPTYYNSTQKSPNLRRNLVRNMFLCPC